MVDMRSVQTGHVDIIYEDFRFSELLDQLSVSPSCHATVGAWRQLHLPRPAAAYGWVRSVDRLPDPQAPPCELQAPAVLSSLDTSELPLYVG